MLRESKSRSKVEYEKLIIFLVAELEKLKHENGEKQHLSALHHEIEKFYFFKKKSDNFECE